MWKKRIANLLSGIVCLTLISYCKADNIVFTQETIETGITPEKLISDMIQCEDKQDWDQYWKYWESNSHSYWQMLFSDKEAIEECEGVTTVRSANLLGIAEVELEQIPSIIRNKEIYKNITNWKAYLVAIDYTVERVGLSYYNGVVHRIIAVGKEKGEWRVIEISEVDYRILNEYYLSCLRKAPFFEWMEEERLNIEIIIRHARTHGIILDSDFSIIENTSINPNAIEDYLDEINTNSDKNWKYINENWYYIENNHELIKERWYSIKEKQYYFDNDGKMMIGWIKLSEKWYYLGLDGAMWHDKWLEDPKRSNIWYYLDSDGAMLSNADKAINGKIYHFNSNGVCLNP